MDHNVNKLIKDMKIQLPITKEDFMRLCKALNMHCTEVLAFEGLIYCRGKQMENGRPEDFDLDRMINFLHMKSKIVAPASNPRIALTTKNANNPQMPYYSQMGQQMAPGSLPALRPNGAMMNQTNRSMIRSQQSYDSQDQRITQGYRYGQRRTNTRGSANSYDHLNRTHDHQSRGAMRDSPSPTKMKKILEMDPEFQEEMQNCLQQMEKMPGLRAKVFNQIGQMATVWND